MGTIYVVTHAIMTICMIGIIAKRSAFTNLILKVRQKRLVINSLYSKIAGLLAVVIG